MAKLVRCWSCPACGNRDRVEILLRLGFSKRRRCYRCGQEYLYPPTLGEIICALALGSGPLVYLIYTWARARWAALEWGDVLVLIVLFGSAVAFYAWAAWAIVVYVRTPTGSVRQRGFLIVPLPSPKKQSE